MGVWTISLALLGKAGVVGLSVRTGDGPAVPTAAVLFFLNDNVDRSSFGRTPGAEGAGAAAGGCWPRWAKRALVELPTAPVIGMGISMTWRLRWWPGAPSSNDGRFIGMDVLFEPCAVLVDADAPRATSGEDALPEKSEPPDSLLASSSGSRFRADAFCVRIISRTSRKSVRYVLQKPMGRVRQTSWIG